MLVQGLKRTHDAEVDSLAVGDSKVSFVHHSNNEISPLKLACIGSLGPTEMPH